MKNKLKFGIVLALALTGLAAQAQTGANYYLKSHPDWPPLPWNSAPGFPVTGTAPDFVIQDMIGDGDVLARAMRMGPMDDDDDPPPAPGGGGDGTDPGAPQDDPSQGTFIFGLDRKSTRLNSS